MVHFQIENSGTCNTCNVEASEIHILDCFICKKRYHGLCNGTTPFTTKTFLNAFKKLQNNDSFWFVCPHCVTDRENTEASTLKDQMAEVVKAVAQLTREVTDLKKGKERCDAPLQQAIPVVNAQKPAWITQENTNERKKEEKVTVCIKSGGSKIDLSKMKDAVTSNGIQIVKTSVNRKNGDVYVDFPSNEQRDKLLPLLRNETLQDKTIVDVKSRNPVITIRNVSEFISNEDLIEKIKNQNKLIADKIDSGSEFSIIFTKEHKLRPGFKRSMESESDTTHEIVARVSEDIREVLKSAGDKIYIGFSSLRIFDRFYIKSCAKCHRFGHYHAECENTPCCGYCGAEDHESKDCVVYNEKNQANYKCVNCKDAGKPSDGHSCHWYKCPAYIEEQKKMKLNIPYYTKNC